MGAAPRTSLASRLPDFPWDTLAGAKAKAAAHVGGIVDLSVGTPVDPVAEPIRRALYEGSAFPGYPATIGSEDTPSPSGEYTIERVARNPNYTYDPEKNFQQGKNDQTLTLPPGPNGPVGTVWIALSPRPRLGVFTIRSKARSSVGLTASRK